jgi:hypothetical protein
MTYLINTLAVIGFIVIYCLIAGYVGYRINKCLDNKISSLSNIDTGVNDV